MWRTAQFSARLRPPAGHATHSKAPIHRALSSLCALFAACSGIGACSAIAASPASAAGDLAGLQSDLAHQLETAGPQSSAYVYDLTAKQVLFSERAGAMRPPASVEKLLTATTALDLLGPSARLRTTVLGAGYLAPGGVWVGNLYLRGGGDPTFGSGAFIRRHYGGRGASVSALAHQLTRVDGIRRVVGSIEGDESYLDSRRGEPSSGYGPDPFLEGTLSGLAFNRGAVGREHGPHAPAAYAAHQLWAALKEAHVQIRGASGAAAAPVGAIGLATVSSPTIGELTGLMLPPSDNFFAEMLIKDLGARFAGTGTTAAGASVVRRTIAALLGIHPRVVDGSGLSSADLVTAAQIGELLTQLQPTTLGAVLRSDLAVAGRTGTLERRMRKTTAAGRCQGKTGTLIGVSNLVGYCQTVGGHLLAFALLTDGVTVEAAHTVQDHMAITIAGY
jgi:D-alanyl-D-alanine carboxypeptidase/D-alanyl-D-alanine-endopeptidase (penicillin-binding protein 4)